MAILWRCRMQLRETLKDPATSALVLCVYLLSSLAWGPVAGLQWSGGVFFLLWFAHGLRPRK